MKKLIISSLLLIFVLTVDGQTGSQEILQDLENNRQITQVVETSATLTAATRLFKDKDDLTSVILVIPSGTVVTVLESADTYLKVVYEGNEGFILARHAVIDKKSIVPEKAPEPESFTAVEEEAEKKVFHSRIEYLQDKYGEGIGQRIFDNKIWKGMSGEMVIDSWGSPRKISRVISGNDIKEEWFYNRSWLYILNDRLTEWGPVKE